jgi:hypothetical protein
LEQVINDQKRYYRYGLHGSKLDVAPSLDPAARCLLSEQRVPEVSGRTSTPFVLSWTLNYTPRATSDPGSPSCSRWYSLWERPSSPLCRTRKRGISQRR